MTKNETYTVGLRNEYMLDDGPGVVSHPMTYGEAQILRRALRKPGIILVRQVTYGPWLPWASPEAARACLEPHSRINACPRCGFDPLLLPKELP
jgi:hypothetical protein